MRKVRKVNSLSGASDKVRNFIETIGKRQFNRKADIDYAEIMNKTNSRFRTGFSIHQITAFLGRKGYHN